MKSNMPPALRELIPIADAICATVGPYCEVVIHNISQPEHSAAYIAGNVTNRTVGAPLTDLVLRQFRQQGDAIGDILGYRNLTKEGKTLRSSTVFVRDEEGKVVGCLCINIDQTPLVAWRHFLEHSLFPVEQEAKENFASGMTEALNGIIQTVLEGYGGNAEGLSKDDKTAVVQQLDERGVFLMKGSVELVAGILGVTRYTIYNYIDASRAKNGENQSSQKDREIFE